MTRKLRSNAPAAARWAATLSLAGTTVLAVAQPSGQPPGPGHGGPHGPPPEAVAACTGKAVGAQASFTDRGGRTVSGTCAKQGDVLAVRPDGAPHGAPPASSAN